MAGLKDLAARLRMADGGDIKRMLPEDLRKALRDRDDFMSIDRI